MTMDNRRHTTRVKFETKVSLIFAGETYEECDTEDLSVKGLFVKGVGRTVGEECEVTLRLLGLSSELMLEMKGKVARVTEKGIAIHFYEFDLDSFYHLKNIVYYNSDNPDELHDNYVEL